MNYFNLKEIPLPEGARPDGNRVYVFKDAGGGRKVKVYIGVYANKVDGTFYANDSFRLYFPNIWEKYYGNSRLSPHFLALGMHLLVLLLSHQNGLYPILHEAFGPLHGNALMDFAVYSIKERQNAAYLFKPAMAQSVLFSKDRFDDDFLSCLFNEKIKKEDIDRFRQAWLSACKERDMTDVWLTIDGSNSNCEINSPLAQEGKAKSGKNVTIVSYIWAVNAQDGMPVAYFLNEGGTVDVKAIEEMRAYLDANGMKVKGFILDRGFVSHDVLDAIEGKYEYVLKLKSDTYAHVNMVSAYGRKIYWNINYLIGEDALFGITEGPWKLFEHYENKAYISLYFDGKNGSERKVTLFNKIYQARKKAQEAAEKGKCPEISPQMEDYLKTVEVPSGDPQQGSKPEYLVVSSKEATEKIFRKGFDSIASSKEMDAADANRIYHLRDASEKQFMVSKSMLGSNVFRSHATQGIESRELAVFIAAILRCSLMNACKKVGADLPRIIEELDAKLFLVQMTNGIYTLINKGSKKIENLLEYYSCTKEDLDVIVGDVTERERNQGIGVSQYHDLPEAIRAKNERRRKKHSGKNPLSENEAASKAKDAMAKLRKPGRPKGSRNRKTIEREKEAALKGTAEQPVKRGPGRPRGRKNNSTLAREASMSAVNVAPSEKRRRGRPAGSKDKIQRTRRTKKELIAEREKQQS